MELTIFTDGGARGNPGPAAIGVVAYHGDDSIYQYSLPLGTQTNNTAEYLALLSAVSWLINYAQHNQLTQVTFKLDSELVVKQLNGQYKVKHPDLQLLHRMATQQLANLNAQFPIDIQHVKRADNTHADALVNQALDALLSPSQI